MDASAITAFLSGDAPELLARFADDVIVSEVSLKTLEWLLIRSGGKRLEVCADLKRLGLEGVVFGERQLEGGQRRPDCRARSRVRGCGGGIVGSRHEDDADDRQSSLAWGSIIRSRGAVRRFESSRYSRQTRLDSSLEFRCRVNRWGGSILKLELDFDATVELSILNALEALTDPFRSSDDVDLQLATQHLRRLRDAMRPRRSQLEAIASTTLNKNDYLLRERN